MAAYVASIGAHVSLCGLRMKVILSIHGLKTLVYHMLSLRNYLAS